jgi:hypothetical protein
VQNSHEIGLDIGAKRLKKRAMPSISCKVSWRYRGRRRWCSVSIYPTFSLTPYLSRWRPVVV